MDRIANWPLPIDIPLPLPADSVLLQTLLVLLFLWHILFVNLMVGGSLLTVAFQINTDVGVIDDSTDLVPALEAALADLAIGHVTDAGRR